MRENERRPGAARPGPAFSGHGFKPPFNARSALNLSAPAVAPREASRAPARAPLAALIRPFWNCLFTWLPPLPFRRAFWLDHTVPSL